MRALLATGLCDNILYPQRANGKACHCIPTCSLGLTTATEQTAASRREKEKTNP